VSDLFGDPPAEIPEDVAAIEAEAIAASLEAEGVKMCERCGIRPVRPRKSATGRAPTTCQVCAAAKGRGGKSEAPPASVRITLGGGGGRKTKADTDAQMVENRAKQAALAIATGLTVLGARTDAKLITDGAGAWSKAVGGLAEYEPWLVKLCQGGEVGGRGMAWLTVGIASAGIVVPILISHEMIPAGPLAMMFESVSELAAKAAAEAEEAADPAAA
jgi:hypothetical protein